MEKSKAKTKGKIEFEEVTLKVPTAIMQLLRDSETSTYETPTQYLERCIVDMVRSDIDAGDRFVPTPREISEKYKLDPIFKEITGITVSP